MLKVISFTICPFVQRITAMLEAKQLPYEVEYISLSDKPQWFLDISPNGQVPVLVTEDNTALFESDAIAEYLEDKYGAMQPELSVEQKAINRAWSYLGTKHYLVQCGAQSSRTIEDLKERSEKLRNAFEKEEGQLGKHRYFNSDELSMVDMAWLPLLHRADIIRRESGYDFLEGFSKVKAWQAAILDTGLAERSVSEDFMEKFRGFYLSEERVLGRCDFTDCCTPKTINACEPACC
ncbi:glutathione S-transferase family protein [Enterovibrio coralii]|uniref:Glutathione S-transferase n=1 Tax=Enterovibrio coralii TaxID=294935 RepID=A0A135I3U3_9GAMM|nr:glutathione S-transferase family protein [Enterovibrio coralii]KXF80094.1 glutathione S-transferase [Enterovibrio coralii]